MVEKTKKEKSLSDEIMKHEHYGDERVLLVKNVKRYIKQEDKLLESLFEENISKVEFLKKREELLGDKLK